MNSFCQVRPPTDEMMTSSNQEKESNTHLWFKMQVFYKPIQVTGYLCEAWHKKYTTFPIYAKMVPQNTLTSHQELSIVIRNIKNCWIGLNLLFLLVTFITRLTRGWRLTLRTIPLHSSRGCCWRLSIHHWGLSHFFPTRFRPMQYYFALTTQKER